VLRDLQPQVQAQEAEVERVEAEIAPAMTLPGPKQPPKEDIEMHNLLHDPPMPWCDFCVQAKGIDACHQSSTKKPVPVIQFDYAEAGDRPVEGEEEVPNFDFAVAVDMASGFPWATAVLSHGKEDVYSIASFTSYLSELGYNKVIWQSDGEPAAVAFINHAKARIAKMEAPPCEIIVQTSMRYSHQSNGGAERMVATIRNR